MKLSLFIGAEHRSTESMAQRLSEHAEQVRLARQLGFDGVSIGNHLSYGSTAWFPPFETLMRLAAEADGMSLGTCMLILPLYDPLHVAEQGKPTPADFPVLRNIVVAPDRGTAIRDVGPAIAESYRIFGDWGLFTGVVGDANTHPEF